LVDSVVFSAIQWSWNFDSYNSHRLAAYTKVVYLHFVCALPGKQNDGPTAATAVTMPAKPASKFHYYSAVTVHMVVVDSIVTQHSFNAKQHHHSIMLSHVYPADLGKYIFWPWSSMKVIVTDS